MVPQEVPETKDMIHPTMKTPIGSNFKGNVSPKALLRTSAVPSSENRLPSTHASRRIPSAGASCHAPVTPTRAVFH